VPPGHFLRGISHPVVLDVDVETPKVPREMNGEAGRDRALVRVEFEQLAIAYEQCGDCVGNRRPDLTAFALCKNPFVFHP
jgi:hypothetical protein